MGGSRGRSGDITPPPPATTAQITRVHKRRFNDQQKRRELFLKRQNENREEQKDQARHVASDFLSTAVEGKAGEQINFVQAAERAASSNARACNWFASRFMVPEHMIELPPSLHREWFVMPLPSGDRCCAVSFNGTTTTRLQRSGAILHRFSSPLPSGNPSDADPTVCCVLDCVFHEPDNTYYVLDLMCWKTFSLLRSTAAVRFKWLQSKVVFEAAPLQTHKFKSLPIYKCDPVGLVAAYKAKDLAVKLRDGLLFVHMNAHYVNEITPLSLVWMDHNCSRRVRERTETDTKEQQIVLHMEDDGSLWTGDEPPVLCGSMSQQFVESKRRGLLKRGGLLLEFRLLHHEELLVEDGKPVFYEEQFKGVVEDGLQPRRADNCAKIFFLHQTRNISFERLWASVSKDEDREMANLQIEQSGFFSSSKLSTLRYFSSKKRKSRARLQRAGVSNEV